MFEVANPGGIKDYFGFIVFVDDVLYALTLPIEPMTCMKYEAVFLPWFDKEFLCCGH